MPVEYSGLADEHRRRPDARRPLRRLAHGRDPRARPEGVRDRPAPDVQRRRGARRRQGPVLGLPDRAGHVRRRPPHVPDRRGRLPPRRERVEHAEGRRVGEGGRASAGATVEDESPVWAQLALQGPRAEAILQPLTETPLGRITYYRFEPGKVVGVPALVSRTGYTGEDGFEVYLPPGPRGRRLGRDPRGRAAARHPARRASARATRCASRPCSRSTATTSTTRTTPWEANLGWIVKMKKGDFIGREALAKQKEAGVTRRLVGFEVTGRGIARHGYPVSVDADGPVRRRDLGHADADRRQGDRPRVRPRPAASLRARRSRSTCAGRSVRGASSCRRRSTSARPEDLRRGT